MEPADQIPRSRNRPPQNQNQPPALNDNNFVISDYIQGCDGDFLKQKIIKITNDVDLISNGGLEMIGQQFVRMRDIRWGKARHPRHGGWASQIYWDMNLVIFVRSRDRLRFFAAVTKSWRRRLDEACRPRIFGSMRLCQRQCETLGAVLLVVRVGRSTMTMVTDDN